MSEAPDELEAIAAALGRRAEQRELIEREAEWEAVVRGELELDAAIERAGDLDDEQAERAAAYFRPFDADETASLVDGLLAGAASGDASEVEAAPPESEGAEVVPLRPPPVSEPPATPPKHDPGTSGFWWIPGGMLIAAAAAIVLWWVWPPSEEIRGFNDDSPKLASVEPLPAYVLETDGGLKSLRGDTGAAGRHRYHRSSEFEWILRPKADAGEVGVRAFAFVEGSSAALSLPALDGLAQVAAESGAIRISGIIEQLELEPGRYVIALVIGRPDSLPSQASTLDEPDAPWQVRRVDIEIAAEE